MQMNEDELLQNKKILKMIRKMFKKATRENPILGEVFPKELGEMVKPKFKIPDRKQGQNAKVRIGSHS